MGMLSALAMTDEELGMTLEEQIGMHFATNCYPRVPQQMIPTAIEALDMVNDCCGEHMIELPEGVSFRGNDYVSGNDVVEAFRLYAWIEEEEGY